MQKVRRVFRKLSDLEGDQFVFVVAFVGAMFLLTR